MPDVLVDYRQLRDFIYNVMLEAGFRENEAAVEADVLVWADLRGLASHGVFRVPMYLSWMQAGRRNPKSEPKLIREKGAARLIDADQAPGLFMMTQAMQQAVDLACEHAVGWVVIRRLTHTGPMGYYVRQAAEQGMVGLTAVASSPLMAYHGSAVPALGTSPLAISVPRRGGEPVTLDMSSAAIPWGKLAQARMRGETLPDGVALDGKGRVTTDPNAAAVVLPLAGAKGSGLGYMIECLTSILGGFPLAAPMLNNTQDTGNAQNAVAIAVDPEAFGTADEYAAAVDELSETLAALPRAEGVNEILMPGERGDRESALRRRNGISLPADLWQRLSDIARGLGVSVPETA